MDVTSDFEMRLLHHVKEEPYMFRPHLVRSDEAQRRFSHAPEGWADQLASVIEQVEGIEMPLRGSLKKAWEASEELMRQVAERFKQLGFHVGSHEIQDYDGVPLGFRVSLDPTEESVRQGHTVTTPKRPEKDVMVQSRNPHSDEYIPAGQIIVDEKAAWKVESVERLFVDEDLACIGYLSNWEHKHVFVLHVSYIQELTVAQIDDLQRAANKVWFPKSGGTIAETPFRTRRGRAGRGRPAGRTAWRPRAGGRPPGTGGGHTSLISPP